MKSLKETENRLKKFTNFWKIKMCDECGCGEPGHEHKEIEIKINKDIYKENDKIAEHNKSKFLEKGIQAINVMGSVGSGKTTLIKALCRNLKDKYRIKVIAGDITTDIDAKRISEEGIPVHQINTGGMCHLDAELVHKTLHEIGTDDTDIIFIENVGNLICPASFSLGETKKMVVISVTEGPYMVVKHPVMFRDADIVIVNKTDLADAMEVDPGKFEEEVHTMQPKAKVLKTSLKNMEKIEDIIKALDF